LEKPESRLAQNASALAIFPILGLLGGILFGLIRAGISGSDAFAKLQLATNGGFLGTIFGTALAVLVAFLDRKSLFSLRRMMTLILVAAVLLGAVIILLRDLIGSGAL
jgi:hypothetical protein